MSMKLLDPESAPSSPADQSGRRERAKAANREAILAAARDVFAELGYDAATVRDIIRRTELASGTFYNYFRSKEEVFKALADDTAHRLRPILRAAREKAESFEQYLRLSFQAYFEYLSLEHPEIARPIAEQRPQVRTDTPEMRAVYAEVREGLSDAIARGLAPRIDSTYLSLACIGLAQELGASMLERHPRDPAAAAEFAAGLILHGVSGAQRGA